MNFAHCSWYILQTFLVKVGQANKACEKIKFNLNLFSLQTGSLLKLFLKKLYE